SQRSWVTSAWSESFRAGSTFFIRVTRRSCCSASSRSSTRPSAIASMNVPSFSVCAWIWGVDVSSSQLIRRGVDLLASLAAMRKPLGGAVRLQFGHPANLGHALLQRGAGVGPGHAAAPVVGQEGHRGTLEHGCQLLLLLLQPLGRRNEVAER